MKFSFPWHRPPRSKAPPFPAFIRRLDLHIRYQPRSNQAMATATLTWTPPTSRTDGTALPPDQIAGADVFDSASLTPTVPVGSVSGASGSFTTDILAVGVHNFTVITRDTTGHSSAASNMASATVPAVLANPSAVTDLAAVLNP
jgi:hypothetical protein